MNNEQMNKYGLELVYDYQARQEMKTSPGACFGRPLADDYVEQVQDHRAPRK